MKQKLETQRLMALFALGTLLLNFPILMLWDRGLHLWGLPLMPLALFGVWLGLISALAWAMERHPG